MGVALLVFSFISWRGACPDSTALIQPHLKAAAWEEGIKEHLLSCLSWFSQVWNYPVVWTVKQLFPNPADCQVSEQKNPTKKPLELLLAPSVAAPGPRGSCLWDVLCARLLWNAALHPCGSALVISTGREAPWTHDPCCAPWLCFFNILCAFF